MNGQNRSRRYAADEGRPERRARRTSGRRDRAVRYGRVVTVVAALAAVFAAAACGSSPVSGSRPEGASRSPDRARAAYTAHAVTTLPNRYITALSDGALAARYGYNLADVQPDRSVIDALPAGVRALVWIGDYSHVTCSFARSDANVRAAIAGLAGDPKVAGYYIDDEADYALPADGGYCQDVVAQAAARSALVHELAPGTFTYEVVSDPGNYKAFAHVTDVLGATAFPCLVGKPCDWNLIPDRIAALDAAQVPHYWAVLDAFAQDQWRWPTPAELTNMIWQWERSRWEGEQTFAWTWRSSSLASQPSLLAVLSSLNTGQLKPPSG